VANALAANDRVKYLLTLGPVSGRWTGPSAEPTGGTAVSGGDGDPN
jgi:hypothetical protein